MPEDKRVTWTRHTAPLDPDLVLNLASLIKTSAKLQREAEKAGAAGVGQAYRRTVARLRAIKELRPTALCRPVYVYDSVGRDVATITLAQWDGVQAATGVHVVPDLWRSHLSGGSVNETDESGEYEDAA